MNIIEITSEIGIHHGDKKEAEKDLKKYRQKFFDLIDDKLASKPLATKTVSIPDDYCFAPDAIEEWISKYYPAWVHKETKTSEDGEYFALIEENPTLKKFSFVNPEDGFVYQRIVSEGSQYLDDEKLAEEYPEVWQRVSTPNDIDLFTLKLLQEITGDDQYACEWYLERSKCPDWPRTLIDLEEIDSKDIEVVGNYMVPGKLEVKLASPRKAKPEEIDGTDDN